MNAGLSAWIRHLRERRGIAAVQQFSRMFFLHRTAFSDLLQNIYNAIEPSETKFTFPIVASTASNDIELTRSIVEAGHEIASHGFKHLRYKFLSPQLQENDIKQSLDTFKKMGISVKGFRAPYNSYNGVTPSLVEKYSFLWDGGIGYNQLHNKKRKPFHVEVGGKASSFVCLPLNHYTDDYLIDSLKVSPNMLAKVLCKVLDDFAHKGGILMFDLHPIRIGQKKYSKALRIVANYGKELGGWFPTVSEAVAKWKSDRTPENQYPFVGLFTGDIDNYTFFRDYLGRIRD